MSRQWTVLHLFAGAGGGSLGFKRAGFRSLGAVDINQEACADLEYLTGHAATCVDIAEMVPSDLLKITGGERPDVVFTSPPCKAFSGCLPQAKSRTDKYLELSNLSQLGIWLALEAWSDSPPPLIVMENVPRIQSRGRDWLDQTQAMLRSYGYASKETTHDCGELGGLAQSRDRFLMVARQMDQVPGPLFVPDKQPLKSVGEVLGKLPVPAPDSDAGGPMHHLPRLSALNWVRLATIPAGEDWHAIPDRVALSPRSTRHNGGYGVNDWSEAGHTVVGESSIQNGWKSVADPRLTCAPRATAYGMIGWPGSAGTVVGAACHDNGGFSVADPRMNPSGTRMCKRREGGHGVIPWSEELYTAVTAAGRIHNHPCSVADPRLNHTPRGGGHGVHDWEGVAQTVIGDATTCKGFNLSDPRHIDPTHTIVELDGLLHIIGPELDLQSRQSAKPVPVIRSIDGAWHRPMTTLELAALQGFPTRVDGEWLELAGGSHKRWRQRIGNAVPPATAEAIASACAATLEASESGGMILSSNEVWVDRRERLPA